jgi:hypothetical protein
MDFDELLPSWFKFFEVVELGSWPEDVKLIFLNSIFWDERNLCEKHIPNCPIEATFYIYTCSL